MDAASRDAGGRRIAMPRYIDADALLADIERTKRQSGCVNHESEIMDCIEYAPTIDAMTVVRGEWRVIGMRPVGTRLTHYCSVCDGHGSDDMNYCPNCGCDMRGESNADNIFGSPFRR